MVGILEIFMVLISFSYCAICCLKRLDRIDLGKAYNFVASCKNFDGGFGCIPGGESHAGQTLAIGGALHRVDRDLLGLWLVGRQLKLGGSLIALGNFQIVVRIGTMESKSLIEEHDLGERISPCSKQHSMRKSRVSGELVERDVALLNVQSSVKLPTATPLNPVTPLRWKSSKRIEFEKRKLQEEIKAKEVVKEEEKNMTLAKEEKNDHSKMATTSTRGNGIETPYKVDTPTSNQDDKMFTSYTSTSESMEMILIDEKVEDRKHFHPITHGGSSKHVKLCEEVSSFSAKHGMDQTTGDNSGTDRKPLTGDESTAITIDFLRARLLAERASSKALKECIQQLTKKVQELEGKLNQEIQSSQKAKEAKREALMKVESFNECEVSFPSMNEALTQHEEMKIDQQVEELDQAHGKCQVPIDMEDTKSSAIVDIKPSLTQSTSLEINELEVSEVKAILASEQEKAGDLCVQSSDKSMSLDVNHDGIHIVPSIASTNGDTYSPTSSGLKRQEIRFSIEERLHQMWNQMAVEMDALAEDKTIEDRVREELLKWMHEFPSLVQNILPKHFEEKKLVLETNPKNVQQEGGDVLLENLDLDQALISKEEIVEECLLEGASNGDGSRTHNKGLKKVASLIERYEANESIQWKWEQSNGKQNLTSRERNNKGSLSRTNSNPGTPSSIEPQQTRQQEVTVDEPPKCLLQVEDSGHYSLAMDSSISPHKGMIAESLFIAKDNCRVGIYTSGDSTPSTYPNSPIVRDKARRSGGDKITPIICHGTLDPNLEQTKCGLQGSMDASFITPPLFSPSFGPRIGEKRGDVSIILEDRSQLLKPNNHRRTLDENCLAPESQSHSERSSGEIRAPTRSRALIDWVNMEDLYISPALTKTRDHNSLQWDASIKGRHLQYERLAPYSQAGNSNAYIRPNHYPVRNDEREIYRGRMESVSRSMEGFGSSWRNDEREIYRGRMESVSRSMEGLGSSSRSLSDGEGDETQLFANIPDAIASSTSKRSNPQMPFQENGGSRWSNYYQPENIEEMSQSYAYLGRNFPRENSRSRSPSSKVRSTSSKANEVLKALQLAKLSIQNSGTRRSTIPNTCYPTSERSYAQGDRHNLRTDYGFSDGRITNETPVALRDWSHPEISRSYSTGTF